MSTVSAYVSKTELTPRALNAMVIPVVSILFLGGLPGVPKLMPMLWDALFPTTMPVYLSEAGAVFSWSAIAAGLVEYFASRSLAEDLRVRGDIKTLGLEDFPVFGFYLIWWGAVMWWLQIPVTATTLAQGGLMVVLLMSFYSVPWYLNGYFSVPRETEDMVTKVWVFLLTIGIAAFFTTLAIVGMRAAEFYL